MRFESLNEDIRYISAPKVMIDASTSRVLVMEYIDGFEIDDFLC